MNSTELSHTSPLVDALARELSAVLTKGLSKTGSRWVEMALRGKILPYELRFAVGETAEEQRLRLEIIRDDWLGAIEGLDARARWRFVLRKYYFAQLLPLSDRALELAIARSESGAVDEQSAREAAEIASRLRAVGAEARRRAPEAADAVDELLSEALLDCRYAAGLVDVTSLRLGRRSKPAAPGPVTCHRCGETSPAGSKFCNHCGARLNCPSCGKVIEPGDRFCSQCGHDLETQ